MEPDELRLLSCYPDLALLVTQEGKVLYANPAARGLQVRLGRELGIAPGQTMARYASEGTGEMAFQLHWTRVSWQDQGAWVVFGRREVGPDAQLKSRLETVEQQLTKAQAELEAARKKGLRGTMGGGSGSDEKARRAEAKAALYEQELMETRRLLVDGLVGKEQTHEWTAELEEAVGQNLEPLQHRFLEFVDRNLKLAALSTYYQSRVRQLERWQSEARQKQEELAQRCVSLEQTLVVARNEQRPAAPVEPDRETERLAYEDSLTQTPNANILMPFLDHLAVRVGRGEAAALVLTVDIDRLHSINRTLGQGAGDELLRQVGQRIRAQLRPSDVLGRSQQDEFMAIAALEVGGLEGQAAITQMAQAIAQKILNAVAPPFTLGQQSVEITVSIGAVVLTGAARSSDLADQARAAIKQARKTGRGRYHLYGSDLDQRRSKDLVLLGQMGKALENQEFMLRFQPVIDLSNGKMMGCEALLRWNHPSLGMLEPGHFLEVADDAGLLISMGEWVVREACAQVQSQSSSLVAMVNVSGRQVVQADLPRRLMKAWERTKMRSENLVVEIPESILSIDPERTEKLGKELARCKVQLCIDNFGADFSSLKRLKRMSTSWLKLDPSLIADFPRQDDNFRLCRAAVLAGSSLHIQSVGKGVENQAQASTLKAMGCRFAQGKFFSGPVPSGELRDLLKKTWKVP